MLSVAVAIRGRGCGGRTQQPAVMRLRAGKLGAWAAEGCSPGRGTGISRPCDMLPKKPWRKDESVQK